MKKLFCAALALALTAVCGFAEGDSLSELNAKLSAATGADSTYAFEYQDYDGDGAYEAFALVGDEGDFGFEGDIWFVSPRACECLLSGVCCYGAEAVGYGPKLFAAEEGYGGSGSVSRVWAVNEGLPVRLGDGLEGFSQGGGLGEFYSYPSAFDATTDGVGHTYKRYYYYYDSEAHLLREYGGIPMTRSQLISLDGAAEALNARLYSGWSVGEIYYRANGVINVNLTNGYDNANMTLIWDGGWVYDTELDYGGVYEAAATPELAFYPASAPGGN